MEFVRRIFIVSVSRRLFTEYSFPCLMTHSITIWSHTLLHSPFRVHSHSATGISSLGYSFSHPFDWLAHSLCTPSTVSHLDEQLCILRDVCRSVPFSDLCSLKILTTDRNAGAQGLILWTFHSENTRKSPTAIVLDFNLRGDWCHENAPPEKPEQSWNLAGTFRCWVAKLG